MVSVIHEESVAWKAPRSSAAVHRGNRPTDGNLDRIHWDPFHWDPFHWDTFHLAQGTRRTLSRYLKRYLKRLICLPNRSLIRATVCGVSLSRSKREREIWTGKWNDNSNVREQFIVRSVRNESPNDPFVQRDHSKRPLHVWMSRRVLRSIKLNEVKQQAIIKFG